jgi:cytochrome c553
VSRRLRRCGLALTGLAAFAGLAAAAARTADGPFAWAFAQPSATGSPIDVTPRPDTGRRVSVPGSARSYDTARVRDLFGAVDWFPASHPTPPRAVISGRAPDAMACGYCHLPDGQGRPENAALAGLPAPYIVEQIRDIRTGARTGADPDWIPTQLMTRVGKAIEARDAAAAARYFSTPKYRKVFRIVETPDIPAVTPILGLYRATPAGGRTPLGSRIIELPNDVERFELRDNRPGYTAYVPQGAVGRGRALARGAPDLPACASCHGAALHGAIGPPIAGRYPAYIFRQLLAFAHGGRTGPAAAPMIAVARQLKPAEMVDVAAYAASLDP